MNSNYGKKPIIALCGRNCAGKTTLAKALATHWAIRDDLFIGPHLTQVMSFAEPLKDSLIAMLDVPRNLFYPETPEDRIRRETICRPLTWVFSDQNMSARKLMLDYGAAMREAFGECVWTNLMQHRINNFFARHAVESPIVIIDDTRFQDEFVLLQSYGAIFVVVHIEGDKEENTADETSVEWQWKHMLPNDVLHITTDHTEQSLRRNVQEITKVANEKFNLFLPN